MQLKGSVGGKEIGFEMVPKQREGETSVVVDGKNTLIRWKRDTQGVWIEFPNRVVGFDVRGTLNDDGVQVWTLVERGGAGEWKDLRFSRAGERAVTASVAGAKKRIKVKSQMPGKIIRILVQEGDSVQKGAPLLVMEAMKMENEIRATGSGEIKKIAVQLGQAIETGALLMELE